MATETYTSLPILPEHTPGCGPLPERRSRVRAYVLIAVHVVIFLHIAHWKITGSTLTPLEPSEAGETLTLGYVNAGFILLVLLLLSTLLLGRFFCGWACHVVALQDAAAWLLGCFGLRPKPIRSRLLAFVPLFAAVWMFVLPSVFMWLDDTKFAAWKLHLMTDDFWVRFPGWTMGAITFFVVGFVAVWVLGAKGFCTYGCPYGALFGIADRFAPGRIRVNDNCEQCGHCTALCTSNVRVHEEVARFGAVVDPGCMKCMDCVRSCPKDALFFGFGSAAEGRLPKGKPRRTFDFTVAEEILGAVAFILALYAFRSLYGLVPFLLAIALGVLAAISVIVLLRLFTRKALTFQHSALKREGSFTSKGLLAFAGVVPFLGLSGHSGFVQYHARQGDGLLRQAATQPRGSTERSNLLAQSRDHLGQVLRFGLLDSSEVHNKLGQIAYEERRAEEAEKHLVRAVELMPENRSARVYLVDLMLAKMDVTAALDYLEELVDIDPFDPLVHGRLRLILDREPSNARALDLAQQIMDAIESR